MRSAGRSVLPWRRLVAFIALPVLSAVVPLSVIPLLVRVLGADGWSSIAIGMSIGAAGSIIVNWGWGVIGPAEVARLDMPGAARLYSLSFFTRLVLFLPVAVICFLLAEFLDQTSGATIAGLMAVAAASSGLSPAWYFIGIGRAAGVALWDTMPRILAAVAAVPLLLVESSGVWYALSNLFFCTGAWVAAGLLISRRGSYGPPSQYWHAGVASLKQQGSLALSGIISGGYTSLTVAIVGAVNFPAVAPFAAADRFRAMGKQGEMAVTNGLQGWVGSSTGADQGTRMLRALITMSGTGLFAGVGFAIVMPIVLPILFGPSVTIEPLVFLFMGVALLMTGVSMSTGLHILAPSRRRHSISLATILGALIGVPAVAVGAAAYGAVGASAGLALAEAVVVGVQLPIAFSILRGKRIHPARGGDSKTQIEFLNTDKVDDT